MLFVFCGKAAFAPAAARTFSVNEFESKHSALITGMSEQNCSLLNGNSNNQVPGNKPPLGW